MVGNALTGVVEWWADEGLRDLGRRRFHQRRRASLTGRPTLDSHTRKDASSRPPGSLVSGRFRHSPKWRSRRRHISAKRDRGSD